MRLKFNCCKKIALLVAVFLCVVYAGFSAQGVSAEVSTPNSYQEKIKNFDTTITVNTDSSIHVVETIVYDFGDLEKHGIYRDIPVKYQTTLGNQSVALSNISVTDAEQIPYQFTVQSSGNNERIKIGDAHTTIHGEHIYRIAYTAKRVIGYFDSYDEIYWNATGNGWLVPILSSSAKVVLPASISQDTLRVSCYYGFVGSRTMCQGTPVVSLDGLVRSVEFVTPIALDPSNGLTVAVGFPKGIVTKSSFAKVLFDYCIDNPLFLLPVIVFLGMFELWWKKGRDPKGSGVIVAEYEAPDGLTPIQIDGILHTKLGKTSLSAEIIYLATKGYIKITRLEKTVLFIKQTDFQLDLLKLYTDITNDFDTTLLEKIFVSPTAGALPTRKISELKNSFYVAIPQIRTSTFNSLVSLGYYQSNPEKVVMRYMSISFVVFIACVVIGRYAQGMGSLLISLFVSILIIGIFGTLMPRKTEKGAKTKDAILGFKEYLQIAEKDRINFHNAPEKNPVLFEKFLPYAMVFGVEKAWAKEFEGIYTTPPSWYSDPYHSGMFNAYMLTDGLGNFNTMAASTLSSAPGGSSGSGGGGFSGGGGGGGGGGSW